MKKDINISVIRIVSMFMIIICHICNEMENKIGIALGQTFNVGVFVFLVISGYLYGKKDIDSPIKWLFNRIKKIMIPVWIWVFVVNIIYLIKGIHISGVSIIAYIFDLQGWFGNSIGLEHLWFLSLIMICYFITPILNKIKRYGKGSFILCGIIFVLSIIVSFINKKVGLYMFETNLYIIAYLYSYNEKNINLKRIPIITYMIFIGIQMCIRLIAKKYFDDTILYSNVIVLITQSLIGISIFMIIKKIKMNNYKKKTKNLINYLDGISYYMYIVHYVFCVGPVDIMGKVGKMYVVQLGGFILISFICAVLLKKTQETLVKCKLFEKN